MKISVSTGGLLLAALCQAAGAHAHLQGSHPANGEALTASPNELSLDFSEGIEPSFSGATLATASGRSVGTGSPRLDPTHDTQLRIPLPVPLATGSYRIDWHVLAKDGHATRGSTAFSVR